MGSRIEMRLDGPVVAKERPRATRRGVTYTPKKTRTYEALVAFHAQQAMVGRPAFEGPVNVTMRFRLPIPRSWSKRKQADPPACTKRPDIDNLIKAILDGCNGRVFADDSQIVRLTAVKEYGDSCAFVVVEEVDDQGSEADATTQDTP